MPPVIVREVIILIISSHGKPEQSEDVAISVLRFFATFKMTAGKGLTVQ